MRAMMRLMSVLPAIGLGLLLFIASASDLAAQDPVADKSPVTIVVDGSESPEGLKKLIDSVAGQNRPVTLQYQAKPPAASAGDTQAETDEAELFELFLRGLNEGWAAIPYAPQFFGDFAEWWRQPPPSSGAFVYLLELLLIVVAAGAAAWLALRLLKPFGPPLPAEGAPLDEKIRPAAVRLLKNIAAATVFILVAWALALWLFDPQAADGQFTRALLRGTPMEAAYIVIGNFLLSPFEPRLRLFTIPRAERHFRLLVLYAIVGMLLLTMAIGLGNAVGTVTTEEVVAGFAFLGGTLMLLFKLWWFWDARRDVETVILSGAPEGTQPRILRRVFAVATPWILILSAIFLWCIGRVAETMPDGEKWGSATGMTQILVVLIPILAVGASALARRRLATASPAQSPVQDAVRHLLVKLSGAAAWLLGLALLGWTWRYHLIESRSTEGLVVLREILAIIAVVVAGWALTSFINALFAAYAPKGPATAGIDEHGIPIVTVQTRLGSVLPILRGFAIGAAIGITILLVMTQLGFNIAPLLAGFGILGLAVSFGSQTLVKDIVSGFFFMVEDAFRVGEYIDTGKLKGTVEKIGLRALQLRHQSGLVHTVPFGTMSQVTNASRDWATVKFSLRLDRRADIDKARKAIKKIGIEMQQDPEFGSGFLLPLKMQGVDEIADSAIVVRAKFTAKPPMTSQIQREALKRIYIAFNNAGIEFASNAVTVRGGGGIDSDAAAAASSRPPVTAAPA